MANDRDKRDSHGYSEVRETRRTHPGGFRTYRETYTRKDGTEIEKGKDGISRETGRYVKPKP